MKARNKTLRSSFKEYADASSDVGRVGARHSRIDPSQQGGSYQDNCTPFEFSVQKKSRELAELQSIGLTRKWLPLVEKIGMQAFIEVWHHLDSMTDSGKSLYIPCISKYHIYQRNLVIQSLAEEGNDKKNIQKYLLRELGIKVHMRTIERAVAAGLEEE